MRDEPAHGANDSGDNAEEIQRRYGPFASMLTTEPGYLCLLFPRPERPESKAALFRVRAACKGATAGSFVCALLKQEEEWQPHLVAAAAVAAAGASAALLDALWSRIEQGSPVISQLCVAAFFADEAFEVKSATLLQHTTDDATREVLRFLRAERTYDEDATRNLVSTDRWKWQDVRTEESVGHAAWWLDAMSTLLKR